MIADKVFEIAMQLVKWGCVMQFAALGLVAVAVLLKIYTK